MTIEEYNRCVEEHADGLYRFVLFRLRDEDAAQDIVQDVFEKMWRLKDSIDSNKTKSYLFTAGYHSVIDAIRRKKPGTGLESIENTYAQKPEYFTDTKDIINAAVRRLPDIQQSVILLRDYEGYSYAEIGEITGLTETQVKVYIYRGRMALKKYLVSMDHLI